MRELEYVVTDAQGIHARPAGDLVKLCGRFHAGITIEKDGKSADAKRIFGVMGLGAKKDDTIVIRAEGEDEEEAISAIHEFLLQNL